MFAFIEQHARIWPVRLMCRVLEVSSSGDYAGRSRPESARSACKRQFLKDVRRVYAGHHKTLRRAAVHAALRAEGHTVSRGRVERLMPRYGITALARRRLRPCTIDSRHDLPVAANLLKQDFSAAKPNTIWLARHHLPADWRRLALPGRCSRSCYAQDRRLGDARSHAGRANLGCSDDGNPATAASRWAHLSPGPRQPVRG